MRTFLRDLRENGDYLSLMFASVLVGAARVAQITNSRFTLPGSLSIDPDYLDGQGAKARQSYLDRCVEKHGYRACLASMLALEQQAPASARQKLVADHRYLVQRHGGTP